MLLSSLPQHLPSSRSQSCWKLLCSPCACITEICPDPRNKRPFFIYFFFGEFEWVSVTSFSKIPFPGAETRRIFNKFSKQTKTGLVLEVGELLVSSSLLNCHFTAL